MGGDHLWEAIGAAGEVLGALAVFVTLVYLASSCPKKGFLELTSE
jgi:hypothetical protein